MGLESLLILWATLAATPLRQADVLSMLGSASTGSNRKTPSNSGSIQTEAYFSLNFQTCGNSLSKASMASMVPWTQVTCLLCSTEGGFHSQSHLMGSSR